MKIKNIIINVLIALFILISLFILVVRIADIKFNPISHHSAQIDEYTIKFKGDLKKANIASIYKDDKKICNINVSIPKSFFDEYKDILLNDLNFDGKKDLLIPHSTDLNGDAIYSVYINNNEGKFEASESLRGIANIEIDNNSERLISKKFVREEIAPAQKGVPAVNKDSQILSIYIFENSNATEVERKAITYYSETNYYCYSHYIYNEENNELECKIEDWFEPSEISKYILE